MVRRLHVLGAVALLTACVPANLSRTVGRGNGELQVSLGGPFIDDLGVPAPVPHLNVGGRVGATDWLDVGANANFLAMAYGIWAVDFLANFQLHRKPGGLAVAGSTRLYTLGDLNDAPDFTALPEVGLHLGGPIPRVRWLQLYGGALGAFNFDPPPDRPPAFFTPFFGVEFLIPARWSKPGQKQRQHGLALHWSWTNPWDTSPSIIGYQPRPGAMALHLGYRLRFGGLDR